MAPKPIAPITRLLNFVHIEPEGGCWTYTGMLDEWGYGKIKIAGRKQRTHRVAYEAMVSPIPTGLTIDHLCRNRACCNPDHLEPVTRSENSRRAMLTPGRVTRAAWGERNAHAKLADAQYDELIRRYAAGERQADLARHFGLGRAAVCLLIQRRARRLMASSAPNEEART